MRINYIPALFAQIKYGLLYNWYAATDARDIAPVGWHVPNETECDTLITYFGGWSIAGEALKEVGTIHWNTGNTGTNSSGFTSRGNGQRNNVGVFEYFKNICQLWTSSLGRYLDPAYGTSKQMGNCLGSATSTGNYLRTHGMAIRLIKDNSVNTGSVTGNDGKIYPTVAIGTQVWMAANLAETKYRSALSIQYGNLYNWYAATDVRGIAPSGWHVPTYAELQTLQTALGGASVGGKKIKESGIVYWDSPNSGTNDTGFSARGGGFRANNGSFNAKNAAGEIWIGTATDLTNAVFLSLSKDNDIALASQQNKIFGCSLRLLKDNSTNLGSMTDYDGNVYPTVAIGTQVWMAQNLIVEHFNNGDAITNVSDNTAWAALTTAGMCYYNNDINNSRLVGDTIPNVTDNTAWAALTTGACCAYNNDQSNVSAS